MVVSVGTITTVLTCLSTIASAVPIAQPRKGFTLKQRSVPATKPRSVNLPGVYAGVFSKYGANVPDNIKAAAANGTAVAQPENNDKEYLTPVNVGDTVLNLDIDTGSADLWVFSNELPPEERGKHSIYKPSSGGTKMEGYSWKIAYGDGSSANGNVWKDTVTVGGVTAHGQAIEAAQAVSQQFTSDKNNDGLLGLGFSSINTVKPEGQKTFIDTVKSSLDSPLFAVSLKHNAPGSYDFGNIDHSKYTGSLKYIDVDSSEGYWMFTASGYGVGKGKVQSAPIRGIADTGTTLLMLPSDVVEAYYKQIPGAQQNPTAGGYAVPCDAEMPSFTVELGGDIAIGGSASVPAPRVSASVSVSTPTVSVIGSSGSGNGGYGSVPYGNYGSGSGLGSSSGLGSGSGLGTTIYGNSGNSGSVNGGTTINLRSTTPGTGTGTGTSTSTGASASISAGASIGSQNQGTYKAVTPGKYLKMSPVTDGGSTCFGGMQSNDGMDFSIFGDVFLKNQYVVFDMEGPRLGFAPQAD